MFRYIKIDTYLFVYVHFFVVFIRKVLVYLFYSVLGKVWYKGLTFKLKQNGISEPFEYCH